ncbi:MAG: hypothetical protein ACPLQO_02210 [Desulfotomaculales bacterium]
MLGFSEDYGVYISSRPGKTATTDYGPQYLSVSVTNPAANTDILSATAPGTPSPRFLFIKQLYIKSSVQAKIRIKTLTSSATTIEDIQWQVEAGQFTPINFFCPLRVPSGGSFKVVADEAITGTVYVMVHGWYEQFINDVVNG